MADRERIRRLVFPKSMDEWEQAKAEQDAAPRVPGRYKLDVGGPPQALSPYETTCEDCGRTLRSGGGVRFGDAIPCRQHPDDDDCLIIHMHWSDNCPAWRHRRWRFWHVHTWGKAERRWKSWRWRRRAKRERSDPAAWADYWRDGGT